MDKNYFATSRDAAVHTLDCINSWINTIDSKASYALSLTAIVTGFSLIQGVPQAFSAWTAAKDLSFSVVAGALLVALLYLSSYITICLLVAVIIARVKPKYRTKSHLFFGSISKQSLQQYTLDFTALTEEEYIGELLDQIHTNAGICSKKAKLYQCGIFTLFIAITLCFICCLLQLI